MIRALFLAILNIHLLGTAALAQSSDNRSLYLEPIIPEELVPSASEPEQLFLELGFIPGAIYGFVSQERFWYVDLANGSTPRLDIVEFQAEIEQYAQPLQPDNPHNTITLTPPDTRLVRISTLGYDAEARGTLAMGLRDQDQNALALVYFDRAASIEGVIDFGSERVFFDDMNVPDQGLYLFGLEPQSDEIEYIMSITEVSDPVYVLIGSCAWQHCIPENP